MAPSLHPVTVGGALESIIKHSNISYENNPRKALRNLGKQYDEIYNQIIEQKPGSKKYEELKKQGQENIRTREKIIGILFTKHESPVEVTKW